jgi:hypothetical protein
MVARFRGRQAGVASAWFSAFVLIVGCASTSPGEPGTDCDENSDCASGSCQTFQGFTWDAHVCSEPCSEVGASCGQNGICRENLRCGPPCEQKTRDALCRAGVLVSCLDLGAAEACLECGCDAFDVPPRSSCRPGIGCAIPAGAGEPCDALTLCVGGYCDPATSTCAPLGELGDSCDYDEQCETDNCSNDGAAVPGSCFQRLGGRCQGEDFCTRCVGDLALESGICVRARCDDELAPCPDGWSCLRSGARYDCFQDCSADDDCEAGYCEAGYCASID